jgi:hypothetical protein
MGDDISNVKFGDTNIQTMAFCLVPYLLTHLTGPACDA